MMMRSETCLTKRPVLSERLAKTSAPSSYQTPSRNDQSQTSFPAASHSLSDKDAADELRQLLSLFH